MKTVIIEDDSSSQLLLNRVLTGRGHEVHSFRAAEDAMTACREEFFPLMILDLHLPGMDGLDFCRWIRSGQWGGQTYILCATGRNQPEDLQAVLEAGANDYISKPLDVASLQIRLAIAERQALEIAQHKLAQELNRSILSTTADGFLIIDGEGRILETNEAYCRLSGYRREELITMRLADLQTSESRGESTQHLGRIAEKGNDRFETRHARKDSRLVDLDVSVSYFPDSGGRFFAFFRDNTERKRRHEERLKNSNLESIGLLAGNIAHEFNNVLTSIIGNVSLTQMELTPGHVAHDWLNNAQTSANRATILARQLLTFAKGGEPIRKTVAVDALINDCLSATLRDTRFNLVVTTAPDLWKAEVDAAQIRQVLDNVLNNAKEAMPKGGTIALKAENFTAQADPLVKLVPGSYVRISIQDAGPGIPADLQSQIFDPYFTTKESAQGLGLAICFSILKKHRGAITFQSSATAGTTFHLFLPAAKASTAEPPAPDRTSKADEPRPSSRVLVMDDDVNIRDLTEIILTRAGYTVSLARDGSEALRIYADARTGGQPFDATIMDLTIPDGMGGKQAIQELLIMDPDARAVVCSGYSDDPVMANFQAYGFKARIPKPFSGDDLKRVLGELIPTTP